MPKLKLPAPPIPDRLNPRPKRPGSTKTKPLDVAAEAGISAIDWVDERTSLSQGARWMMFRKVPKGTNWFYTLGSSTMFAFLSQAVTGVFLAMYYRPDASGGAYESVRSSRPRKPGSRRPTGWTSVRRSPAACGG